MALINCPDCGKEISDQSSPCPNCGRPGPFTEDIEALASDIPADQSGPAAPRKDYGKLIGLLLVIAALVGGAAYIKFVRPHPLVAQCADIIRAHLKSPSSYKMLNHQFVAKMGPDYISKTDRPLKGNVAIVIEYEAANSYNAMVRGMCTCTLGPMELLSEHEFSPISKMSRLGKSPFDEFRIVSAFDEDGKELEIPFSILWANNEAEWLAPSTPKVYISDWIEESSYVLTDIPPTKEEIDIVAERLFAEYRKKESASDVPAKSAPDPPVDPNPLGLTWDELALRYALPLGRAKACGINVEQQTNEIEAKIIKRHPTDADSFLQVFRGRVASGEADGQRNILKQQELAALNQQDSEERTSTFCNSYAKALAAAKMPE